ncbi:uncharacterized protein LOC144572832 [Carex rostrata]
MMTSPLIFTLLFVATSSFFVSATTSPPASLAMLEPTKLFFLPPPGNIVPKIEKCWPSIVKVEGCAADLLSSFANFHVNITSDCCDAVVSFGDECFIAVFTNFPFNPLFPPLLKAFCNAIFAGGRNCNKISPPPPVA